MIRAWRAFVHWIWRVWKNPLSRLALLAGVACVGSLAVMMGPPYFTTASMPQRFSDPVVNVELIREVEDLRLTLGDVPSQDRETMRVKTYLDFAFVAFYVAFLVSLGMLGARRGGWRRGVGIAAALAGLAAGVFDVLENLGILAILEVPIASTTGAMLDSIRHPSTVKWSLAAISTMLLLLTFFGRRSSPQDRNSETS